MLPTNKILFTLLLACFLLSSCQQPTPQTDIFNFTASDLHHELGDGIFHQWFPAVVDADSGGYFSNFTYDWKLADEQNKMIVTQARHLWMSSVAGRHFPNEPMYAEVASHGFPFVCDTMWDPIQGGFYQYVSRSGKALEGEGYFGGKRSYGIAFGIYGLSAYYQLTNEAKALERAMDAFLWLEDHAHDPEFGGYFDILTKEGKALRLESIPDWHPSSHVGLKDYNSSIHLLEAFAELYRAKPDSLVEVRLKEMLHLVRDIFTQEKGYMHLYFTPDWRPISFRDSSELVREANYGTDHVSPGHDIETAFLLLDAEEALGNTSRNTTLEVAKKMVDYTLEYGFDWQKGGFYEQLYYLLGDYTPTLIDDRKNWWAQAEGFHTLVMFSKLFPEEEAYSQAANLQWKYIQEQIIDSTHKGWYSYGLDTDPSQAQKRKGNVWKSAYHNGRALLESIELMGE